MIQWSGTWETQLLFPVLPETSCMTFGKSLNVCTSVLHQEKGDNNTSLLHRSILRTNTWKIVQCPISTINSSLSLAINSPYFFNFQIQPLKLESEYFLCVCPVFLHKTSPYMYRSGLHTQRNLDRHLGFWNWVTFCVCEIMTKSDLFPPTQPALQK